MYILTGMGQKGKDLTSFAFFQTFAILKYRFSALLLQNLTKKLN